MKQKNGYTLIELLITIFTFLVVISLTIGAIWVAVHFIMKFW